LIGAKIFEYINSSEFEQGIKDYFRPQPKRTKSYFEEEGSLPTNLPGVVPAQTSAPAASDKGTSSLEEAIRANTAATNANTASTGSRPGEVVVKNNSARNVIPDNSSVVSPSKNRAGK
jgi:hypothetical protein